MTTGGYDPNKPEGPSGHWDPTGEPAAPTPPPYPETTPLGGYPQGFEPTQQIPVTPPAGPPPPGYQPPPGYGAQPGYGQEPPLYGGQPGYGYPTEGYPPPPTQSYGGYPPPPPGYGPAGRVYDPYDGTPGRFTVGNALAFGWNKFTANWVPWVVIQVGMAVLSFIVDMVTHLGSTTTHSHFDDSGISTSYTTTSIGILGIIGLIGIVLLEVLLYNTMTRAALSEVAGVKPTIGSFFQPKNLVMYILAGILVLLAVVFGFVLLIIPGILAAFFFQWTHLFVIDRNQDAITAMRSSFNAIKTNPGTVILLMLAQFGLAILTICTCGLGTFLLTPVMAIAWAYAYRVTTAGGPIA